jgi:Glyoxalase-like domain
MVVDHLIYAAPELTAVIADLEDRFGVRAQPGGRHIGVGTPFGGQVNGERRESDLGAFGRGGLDSRSGPPPETRIAVQPSPRAMTRISLVTISGRTPACCPRVEARRARR